MSLIPNTAFNRKEFEFVAPLLTSLLVASVQFALESLDQTGEEVKLPSENESINCAFTGIIKNRIKQNCKINLECRLIVKIGRKKSFFPTLTRNGNLLKVIPIFFLNFLLNRIV